MLLIFGVRRRGYRMVNVFAMCGVCHTPAAQAVTRVRTFFTFFFIPLIPLGSKYRSTCTSVRRRHQPDQGTGRGRGGERPAGARAGPRWDGAVGPGGRVRRRSCGRAPGPRAGLGPRAGRSSSQLSRLRRPRQ